MLLLPELSGTAVSCVWQRLVRQDPSWISFPSTCRSHVWVGQTSVRAQLDSAYSNAPSNELRLHYSLLGTVLNVLTSLHSSERHWVTSCCGCSMLQHSVWAIFGEICEVKWFTYLLPLLYCLTSLICNLNEVWAYWSAVTVIIWRIYEGESKSNGTFKKHILIIQKRN